MSDDDPRRKQDIDVVGGFPPVDRDAIPEGLVTDQDYFNISEENILVDESHVVSGYANGAPDGEEEDLASMVLIRLDGILNGTEGEVHKDVTLTLSPEAAASIAQSLIHAISHFPDEHLGFRPDEYFGHFDEAATHRPKPVHRRPSSWTNFPD
jgi:hypothetical protein